MRLTDKKRGCLFGLSIGDSLGAAVEFKQKGEFPPVIGYRSGGPFGLSAGQWTDDTSLALALANSISRGWNLADQLDQYVEWWTKGKYSVNGRCFDIGTTTRSALHGYVDTKQVGADPDESCSGNGSIMRLAPVPIKFADLYPNQIEELAKYGDESSITTHGSPSCRAACKYLTVVLAALINGEEKEKVLDSEWEPIKEMKNGFPKLIQMVINGSYKNTPVMSGEIEGSGWVVKSLEASLYSFHTSNSFEEAVLKAVNLGDDTDTTGAITGQLAGAYWGEQGIPNYLIEGLDKKEMIEIALKELGVN